MKIRDIRKTTGLTQAKFAEKYSIPLPTLQHWERDYTKPPEYFCKLLEKSLDLDQEELVYYNGKHGETYIYSPGTNTISNMNGDKIQVSDVFKRVKTENIPLYISELFDSINHARNLFLMDCEEDTRSDIVWIES